MAVQHNAIAPADIVYLSELLKRATARYECQKSLVVSMDTETAAELAHKERELLVALEDKASALRALHAGLLQTMSARSHAHFSLAVSTELKTVAK